MWVLCPFKTAKSRLVFNLIVQIYKKSLEKTNKKGQMSS